MLRGRTAKLQHFIYPLTERGGYSFDGREITPHNYWKDALAGRTDEWGLSTGYRLIEPGDWVWAYFGESVRRICGVGTVRSPVDWRPAWGRYSVRIRWDPKLTQKLRQNPICYDDYRQQVQAAAVRANDATIRVLTRWLGGQDATKPSHAREVKFAERSVAQRLGQQKFRAEVVRAFGGACAVTGCVEAGVLQAAHILPVGAGGTHALENALLLRADLHNLFDLGLLTVGANLKIELSPEVCDPKYRALSGKPLRVPKGVVALQFKRTLARHKRLHSG